MAQNIDSVFITTHMVHGGTQRQKSSIFITRFIINLHLFGVLVTDSEVNCASVGAEVQFQ